MSEQSPRTTHRPLTAGLAVLAGLAIATGALAASSDPKPLAVLHLSRANTPEAAKLAAGASGDAATSMMPVMGPTEWTHTGEWPALPAAAPVYRLVGEQLRAAEAERIAAALGVNGTASAVEQAPAGSWQVASGSGSESRSVTIWHSDGGNEVSVFQGGPVAVAAISTGAAPGSATTPSSEPVLSDPVPTPPPAPTDLPSAAEAEQIARDLLQSIGAGDAWNVTVSDGSVSVACADTGAADAVTTGDCAQQAAATVTDRFVTLTRTVDGMPIDGLAWYVDIADRGVITSASGTLATLESLGTYPLRPVQDVYDDLVAGTSPYGGIAVPMAKAATAVAMPCRIDPSNPDSGCLGGPEQKVTVTDASLGLQRFWGSTDDSGNSGALVVPGYVFHGRITSHWTGAGAPADETSEWSTTSVAIESRYLGTDEPTTTTPVPTPVPNPDDPAPVDPKPEPIPVDPQPIPVPTPEPGTVEPQPAPTPDTTAVAPQPAPTPDATGGAPATGG